jgi:putative hydrolase of the HAD superfamily
MCRSALRTRRRLLSFWRVIRRPSGCAWWHPQRRLPRAKSHPDWPVLVASRACSCCCAPTGTSGIGGAPLPVVQSQWHTRSMTAGVLFDLFGTLVRPFSRTDHSAELRQAAISLGLDPTGCELAWESDYPNRVRGLSGGIADQLRSIAGTEDKELRSVDVEKVTFRYRKFCDRTMEPLTQALSTLRSLAKVSIPVGLVSNAAPDFAEAFERCPLRSIFVSCVFSSAVGLAKPDPAIFLLAAEMLGVETGELLFVGDGSDDELVGAERAGMLPALVQSNTSDTYDPVRSSVTDWTGIRIRELADVVALVS